MPFLEEPWQCYGLPWKRQSNLLVSVFLVCYLRHSECNATHTSTLLTSPTMPCLRSFTRTQPCLLFCWTLLGTCFNCSFKLLYFVVLPVKTAFKSFVVAWESQGMHHSEQRISVGDLFVLRLAAVVFVLTVLQMVSLHRAWAWHTLCGSPRCSASWVLAWCGNS